ncbi:MAG TPA: hypothetical protein VHW09_12145 [Bryobacteraceae bacterium]|jgi:hypothetical protein|nr:hypothetical protein [Bryobacteraceae bacterium]
MSRDCPECQRLWREYAAATNQHVALESQLRGLEQGSSAADSLSQEVSTAATARQSVRQAIHQHETAEHPEASGAPAIED